MIAVGDRVRWQEFKTIDGQRISAGTGTVIGRDNWHWLVRSDEVVDTHEGRWNEHRMLKLDSDIQKI